MKTNLTVSGRVEISRHEISQAIIEWLERHHSYDVEKIVYRFHNDSPIDSSISAVVEIKGMKKDSIQEKIESFHVDSKEERQRKSTEGWRRVNGGIFDTMRSLLNEEFVKNNRQPIRIGLRKFVEDVKYFHPEVDYKRVYTYLFDKRQMGTNLEVDGRADVLSLRAIINHIPGARR